jgi:hypothetical protein
MHEIANTEDRLSNIIDEIGLSKLGFFHENRHFHDQLAHFVENQKEFLAQVIATNIDAQALFQFVLRRPGGGEREGRNCYEILQELITSEEYNSIIVSHLVRHSKKNKESFEIPFFGVKDQGVTFVFNDTLNASYSIFSCKVKITRGGFEISVSTNLGEDLINGRIIPFLPVMELFCQKYYDDGMVGREIVFSFGDGTPRERCVAYSSNRRDDFLVPDADMLYSHAYSTIREHLLPNWEQRKPVAYWRGTDTGCVFYSQPENCQRVKLCVLSKEYSDLLDAGITAIQGEHDILKSLYNRLDIFKAREQQEKIFEFRYLIVADGNSSAWAGTFNMLLSGGVLLKIESEEGFMQWFYNRLEPWINYVPIKHDLSDLVEKIIYLNQHDSLARTIADNGRKLAMSMDYDYVLEYSAMVLHKAFSNL